MSDETRFTPGPWRIDRGNHEAPHIVAAYDPSDGMLFALAGVWGQDEAMEETQMSRANAHLIAAAPAMYEELTALSSHFHCQCGHPRCSIERTRRDIETLLAKARGKP